MERSERTNRNPDVARVTNEIANRLRARGIVVNDSDSPDEIEALLEGVEDFESAVEDRGGDLMMDEPPQGAEPQPDDPRFLLPQRRADESAARYLDRLRAAILALGQRKER